MGFEPTTLWSTTKCSNRIELRPPLILLLYLKNFEKSTYFCYYCSMAKAEKKLKARIKPELPGGFREYPTADAIARQRLLATIQKTFEDFGFDPLETPAVERTEVLTGGETESQKIIFNIKGSQEKSADRRTDLSLRFDFTVPLARFVAANPELPKPFKRYQIGNLWRGESPQVGRYREFMQADVDIVGSSSMEADAEIITVLYRTLKNLGINNFLIKINNRKILDGLPQFAGFPQKKLWDLLRIMDKKDKTGEDAVKKEISRLLEKKAQAKVEDFLALRGDTRTKLAGARKLFTGSAPAEQGIRELVEIAENLAVAGVEQKHWEVDFSIVRGLGYYTGPVFETLLLDKPSIGSIASGGRYDNLVMFFTGQKIPAVGVSIGVDRLYAALEELGMIKKKKTSTRVLILNLSPEFKNDYQEFARKLREANINTLLYLGDDRAFQAQLAYAVKKEIPYIAIYGEKEKEKGVITIRNMVTREQKEIPKANVVQYFR